MKKTIKITLFIMFVLLFLLLVLIPFGTKTSYAATNSNEIVSLDELIIELFGDRAITEIEYFYNFDDYPDYIYINCEKGYAVCKSDTIELMEYSPVGSLPLTDIEGQIYYAGPGNYYYKQNNEFVNLLTDEHIAFSNSEAATYSNQIRSLFSTRNKAIDIINYSTSSRTTFDTNDLPYYPENPEDFEYGDAPGSEGTTYIDNYEFFLKNPRHGINKSGTCTAVAAQILLNYNNYYNDRRIIPDNYLNGWNFNSNSVSNPEYNPNYCKDPDSKTRETLGSNGVNESDKNTYFNYIIQNIPPSSHFDIAKSGIQNILDSRNKVLDSSNQISYDINIREIVNSQTVSAQDITTEIDSNRPLILALQGKNVGHAVVAYGYQEKNSTLGYIVHFGWSGDYAQYLNVWTNSAWCYDYLTLQINHTHNYNILSDSGEARCEECGYRANAFATKLLGNNSVEISAVNIQFIGDIAIPTTLYGKSITHIGSAAFANQNLITSVSFPATVLSIESNAFQDCSALEAVYFDNNSQLSNIGNAAFYGSGIQLIYVPSNVVTIGANAFEKCANLLLVSFEVNSKLSVIGNSAFEDCKFDEIRMPASVSEIGANAFRNCTKLECIEFEPNCQLKYIGNAAFNNTKIRNITIPANVEVIGFNAFERCKYLKEVAFEIGTKLTTIENSAFAYCTSLEFFNMPTTVSSIGDYVFHKCINMTALYISVIGSNIIPDTALVSCDNLTMYTARKKNAKLSPLAAFGRPIVYGCVIEEDGAPYVVATDKIYRYNPSNITDMSICNNPCRSGYKFEGWYDTVDFSGTRYANLESAPYGHLYAKWVKL